MQIALRRFLRPGPAAVLEYNCIPNDIHLQALREHWVSRLAGFRYPDGPPPAGYGSLPTGAPGGPGMPPLSPSGPIASDP